jgi:sugar-specific transcriptional regulator TrmB
MSREWVLKTLIGLGLSGVEAEVYLFLAQAGPVKVREIVKTLKFPKQQVYRSLESLQTRGLVKASQKLTTQYAAVSLEKILDQFMKEKQEQAKALQASKKELLSNWRFIIQKNSETS